MGYGYDPRDGGGPSQGSSLKGRLLLALLIIGIGWCSYMSHVEKNPVTGERQHVSISPNEEIRLGLESAPQMSREMGGEVPASDPRAQEVQKIGAFLVSHTEAKDSPWKFQFHLLADEETVNAFALPGGQIFITSGLFDKLQTEAQLAGVLSHEMGHVIERHTAQQMAKSQFGQMFVVAIGAAASDQSGTAQTATAVAAMVNQMIQLRYSRADESQADTWGLRLMNEVGFDPRAMVQVMEILKASSGGSGRGPDMFQTHPDPDLRIVQINAYLKEHPPAADVTDGRKLKDVLRETSRNPFR